jgi:hypothetical protein
MRFDVIDWKKEIVIAAIVSSEISKRDTKGMWQQQFPEVAATSEQLRQAEERLGMPWDEKYKRFLQFANGWRHFHLHSDIFGTEEIGQGKRWNYAIDLLTYLEDIALESSKISRSDVFPIGVDENSIVLYLLGKSDTTVAGQVFWFQGYEIERYPNFDEFYLAMVDYNRLLVQELIEGKY